MEQVVFNIHDLTLLASAFVCCFFSYILFTTKKGSLPTEHLLFALLLVMHTLIPIHELIFWGKGVREVVLSLSPNLFFIGYFAYYLDGPLLYLLLHLLINNRSPYKKINLIHLSPTFLFLIYITLGYYQLDSASKVNLIDSKAIAYSWHFTMMDAFGKGLRLVYGLLCLILVHKYARNSTQNQQKWDISHYPWFKPVLVSFVGIIAWEEFLALIKVYNLFYPVSNESLIYIGVSGYYAKFFLVTLLLSLHLKHSLMNNFIFDVSRKPKILEYASIVNDELISHIEQIMTNRKPYLTPKLTFDTFAQELDLPKKELSLTINRHYRMNFHEFINSYRIEDAKKLLEESFQSGKSITQIYFEVGFNSKSVFNSAFKKYYGMTPSEYKKSLRA